MPLIGRSIGNSRAADSTSWRDWASLTETAQEFTRMWRYGQVTNSANSFRGLSVDKLLPVPSLSTRRRFLGTAGAATMAPLTALADNLIHPPLPGARDQRTTTTGFPQQRALILPPTRPP